MDLKEYITIGFSTPKSKYNVVAALIRRAEGTKFSHTYIQYVDPFTQKNSIYHATHTSLNFANYFNFLKKNAIIEEYHIPVTLSQKAAIISYCQDHIGTEYGKMEIVGMGTSRLAKLWFNWNVKNPFVDGEKTQVCSELVGNVLRIIGVDIPKAYLEQKGPKYINAVVRTLVK